MPLQFSGGKGFLIPFNWFSTKCMRRSRPQRGSAAGSILPGTHGEGADRNDIVFNRDGVPAVEASSSAQGPAWHQEGLFSGMQTQPHHHLPNITTDNYWQCYSWYGSEVS